MKTLLNHLIEHLIGYGTTAVRLKQHRLEVRATCGPKGFVFA